MDKALRLTDGHPMSWTPNGLTNTGESFETPQHVYHVGRQGPDEVEQALGAFKSQLLYDAAVECLANEDLEAVFDADSLTRESFPLPRLQSQLACASLDVHQGRGFAIVRGLDPRKYTAEENLAIFLGISNYIGEQRGVQDKKGSMLSTLPGTSDGANAINCSLINHSPRYGFQDLDNTSGDAPWYSHDHQLGMLLPRWIPKPSDSPC